MSFIIKKKIAGAVVLNDLGITVLGALDATLDITDMEPNEIALSASGGDLDVAINAGDIVVVDPRAGYGAVDMSVADSLLVARASNDSHVGVQLASIADLDDVGGAPTIGQVLEYNFTNSQYEPVNASVIAGNIALGDLSDVDDLAAHTADAPVIFMGDGTNYDTVSLIGGTSITAVAVSATSLTFNVDDDFISNQGGDIFGDTSSGTWTVASGSTISIATGGDLTIADAPVNPTDAANKEYVDSVASGLDPKESVRYCTVIDVSGTYAPAGGTGGTGEFTAVDFTNSAIFDGLTAGAVAIGDRILVKSQTEISGFADATVAGAPAGSVVPMTTGSAVYDFDVTVDGGALQPLSITVTSSNDYDAIAALMSAQVVGGSVAFVGGSFQVTSATTGTTSTVVVAAGTAVSGGGDLFAAITAQAVGNPVVTFPTPTAGTASTENGIYVVTTAGATGVMERAPDQDGSPAAEVSGGNYTFVENGTICANTGWVLQGDGILTLNTDPMSWVQFSESSDFSAGTGLALSGSVFSLDINNMSPATIALGDEIAFNDITGVNTPQNTTVENMFKDLNVPYGITGTGIMVQTADDTYIKRSIAVDGIGALDGLAVADADGTGGNPTIGLDIDGMTSGIGVEPIASGDKLAVYNISTGNNVYYTVNDIANAGAANGFGSIVTDVGTASADAPTDPVTFSGNGITITDTSVTTTASVDFALNINDLGLGAETLVVGDFIGVYDGTTTLKYTFTDMIDDLDIIAGLTGTGFVTSDGSGGYSTVTIAKSLDEDEIGIIVTPTDGSSNTTIGLDINGMTNPVEDMAATDEFAVHNKSEGSTGAAGANRKMTGQEIADGTASILNLTGMTVTTIGGQEVLTLIDTTRANKVLSIESSTVVWAENKVGNSDWLQIGNANDAKIGYIVPLNATIVKITAHTTSASTSTKAIDLYVDDIVKTTGIATLPADAGNAQTEFSSVVLNIDISAGEKIQLRGGSTGGDIQDTVVTIWLKWRG